MRDKRGTRQEDAHREKEDANPQFARRKAGVNPNPTRNLDGLHSANPVVTSGNGDATQPLKSRQKDEGD
jgi:hypothetical protein